jgi:hypothetical protein
VLIALVLLIVCQITVPIGAAIALRRWAERKQAEIEQRIEAAVHEWTDAPGPGLPSKAAETVSLCGEIIGRSAAKSIKQSFTQESTALTQVTNGIVEPIEAQANPLITLMTGGRRGKNAAIFRLAQILGPMLGNKGGGNGAGAGQPPAQSSFSL